MDLTRLRYVSFPDGGMLTVTLNTADFFFLCGGFYPCECSTLLVLVSRFMKKASACVGHTAGNPLLHTSALFVRKSERFLKRRQVNSHVKAVMA